MPLPLPSRSGLDRFRLTRHAAARAEELGFTKRDLDACLREPEITYTAARYPGTRTYQRADLAVAVDEERETVITCLLRRTDDWQHGVDTRRSA